MKAETALRRALVSAFAGEGDAIAVEKMATRPWASVTFSGERHELRLRLSDARADALIAGIGEREFDLPGHILIDIAATEIARDGEERLLAVEALTAAAD